MIILCDQESIKQSVWVRTQPQKNPHGHQKIKIIVRETSAIARCGITEASRYSQTNIRDYIVKFIIRIETNQTLIMTLLNTPEQPKIKAVAKMSNGKWATFGFLRWNWIDNLVFENSSSSNIH